jgi:hypothetical protein
MKLRKRTEFRIIVMSGHLCRIDIRRTPAGKPIMRPPRLATSQDLEDAARREGCTPAELRTRLGLVDALWEREHAWRPGGGIGSLPGGMGAGIRKRSEYTQR